MRHRMASSAPPHCLQVTLLHSVVAKMILQGFVLYEFGLFVFLEFNVAILLSLILPFLLKANFF